VFRVWFAVRAQFYRRSVLGVPPFEDQRLAGFRPADCSRIERPPHSQLLRSFVNESPGSDIL
jgi:hypothetical protein